MKTHSSNTKKTSFLRGGILAIATMFLFTSVVVQPVQAQGIVSSTLCKSLQLFSTASLSAMDLSVKSMNATFKLELSLLQATWDAQDQAVTTIRSVSEQAFLGLLDVYSAVTAHTTVEKHAVDSYKDTILMALTVLRTKIDGARSAYREDTLALVKAHQKAMTGMVNVATTSIKSALKEATSNCGKKPVIAKLLSAIAAAELKLAHDGMARQVGDLIKAGRLVATRDGAYLQADVEYLKVALDATAKLVKATLGFRKEAQEAQRVLEEQKL